MRAVVLLLLVAAASSGCVSEAASSLEPAEAGPWGPFVGMSGHMFWSRTIFGHVELEAEGDFQVRGESPVNVWIVVTKGGCDEVGDAKSAGSWFAQRESRVIPVEGAAAYHFWFEFDTPLLPARFTSMVYAESEGTTVSHLCI